MTVPLDAIAYAFEAGYTFSDHPWKPRVSANYAYGSGNKSPFEYASQNVDVFYGFNQPFSRNDYIAWNNVKAPKVRLEFTPAKNLQIDTAFSAYWLASAANAWRATSAAYRPGTETSTHWASGNIWAADSRLWGRYSGLTVDSKRTEQEGNQEYPFLHAEWRSFGALSCHGARRNARLRS